MTAIHDFEIICMVQRGKMYSPKEVAYILLVDVTTVRRWILCDKIKSLKKGGQYCIFGQWIIDFVEKS